MQRSEFRCNRPQKKGEVTAIGKTLGSDCHSDFLLRCGGPPWTDGYQPPFPTHTHAHTHTSASPLLACQHPVNLPVKSGLTPLSCETARG